MTDNELNIIIVGGSVIIALIGLFFIFKIWIVWKQVNKNVLKARVFLDGNFLVRNWICVFLAGAFIAMRRVIQLFGLLGYTISVPATILSDLMGLAVIILLVLLAYYWYELAYSTIPSSQAGRSVKASGSMDK